MFILVLCYVKAPKGRCDLYYIWETLIKPEEQVYYNKKLASKSEYLKICVMPKYKITSIKEKKQHRYRFGSSSYESR